jgi:murein DD-endopeptidase MepM/ murein hydrolase activator NlpD
MSETSTRRERSPVGRLTERLRSVDPMSIGLLGVLSLPGQVFEELAFMKLFGVFFLFLLWPFVAPIVGAVRGKFSGEKDSSGPRDWLQMGGLREHAVFLGSLPLTLLNPLAFVQDVTQFVGSGVAYVRNRGSFPDPESYEQSVSYRLPVEGTWTVVNGSPIKDHSHSWFPVTQRYAYDFVVTDEEGRTRPEGSNTGLENYYCYDEPVVAPADGVVVEVCDGDLESPRAGGFSHPLKRSITGNYVVLRHAADEYSTLAHLVPGSVAVEPGDRVERGERIARCGHSGNSSEPHLHFQVQDHPTFELAAGLPVRFEDVDADSPSVDVAEDWSVEDDGPGRYVHVGQRVTHDPDGDRPRDPDACDPASDPDAESPRPDPESGGSPPTHRVPTLSRTGVGVSVAGALAFVGGIATSSWSAVALLLAGAGLVGVCYRYALFALGDVRPRSGSFGVPAGLGLTAVAVGAIGRFAPSPGIGLETFGVASFLVGVLAFVAVGEYGRRRLRDGVTIP